MKTRVLVMVAVLVLFGLVFVGQALASRPILDKETPEALSDVGTTAIAAQQFDPVAIVTVSRPVQIPRHTLQPGQYSFRLLNSGMEVAVASLDGSTFYGNYIVNRTTRNRAEGGLVYTEETPGGPERISSWFFPGQLDGYSFVYPRTKHGLVAKAG